MEQDLGRELDLFDIGKQEAVLSTTKRERMSALKEGHRLHVFSAKTYAQDELDPFIEMQAAEGVLFHLVVLVRNCSNAVSAISRKTA